MKPREEYRLCYPQLGNYNVPISYFVRRGLGDQYVTPPPMTKKTIELGAKYSPDFVCAPFKCMMGCYIEALEKGANVLIQTGGTCRLGYYGELHEQILNDLGYDFDMMNITIARYHNLFGLLKGMKQFAPHTSLFRILRPLPATAKMIVCMDKLEDYMRQNMGFETIEGAHEKIYKQFLAKMHDVKSAREVKLAYEHALNEMKSIPSKKPQKPVRIGIVGEYFTIMDPDSNHEVEKKFAKMGAEIHRWMNLSNSVMLCPDETSLKKLKGYLTYDIRKFPSSIWHKIQLKDAGNYAKYDMGSSSVSTVLLAEEYAKRGFDGIVHVKSFGCTPEVGAVPVLHNISRDYKVPILFLSYDTQTGDTGIETRMEAFYDMIAMRKEVQ